MASKDGLVIASLDGGGARSFSQLEIMRAIMHRLKSEKYSNEVDKIMLPCEHFDIIGGSGAGGLIAIMFARLQMSVEEASDEFFAICEQVYKRDNQTPSERTQGLRECMEAVMQRRGLRLDLKLVEEGQARRCACFVVASPRITAATKICLRTYPIPSQLPSTITVIEAALATCATQPDFVPVSSGSGYRKKEYIGVGLGANNPVRELIAEAYSLFGGNSTVASFLSLGTGHPGNVSFSLDGGEVNLQKLRDMMNDNEQRAQEIEQQIGRFGIYFRFSVEQGMQNDHPGQTADPGWILAQTESYLADYSTCEKIGAFIQNINSPTNAITLNQLRCVGGPTPSDRSAAALETVLATTTLTRDDVILGKLKPAGLECGSRVAECMDGTRQGVFARIEDWAADIEAPNVLWLKGYPGIGKSAIASSVVERLRASKRLGSSFFFQREQATLMNPNALWRTVAYDLSRQYPTVRTLLVATLEAEETIPTTFNIDKLFLQIIQEPLMAIREMPLNRLPIIVVDGLDECGGLDGSYSEDRKSLMHTIRSWSCLSGRFKLIVTSRGESDIERLFSTTSHRLIELCAGQRVDAQSSKDIKTFLEVQFREITAQYSRSLPPEWPGYDTIMDLTKKAAGIFVWAKTVALFVARGDPDEQLRRILEGSGAGGMGSLYSWILNTSFPNPSEEFINTFRLVVGGIILAKAPLATSTFKRLLSIRGPTLEYICNGLQSVMDSQDILRLNHQSFVDFLIDRNRCPPNFLIDRRRESRNLTLACLQTMRGGLMFNICGLKSSYLRNIDVPGLESQIQECIPPYLSYSCLFWAHHLVETVFDSEILDHLQYFMDSQFLSWLEVLSLTKQTNLGSGILRLLTDWLRTSSQDDAVAVDMQRFVSAFASVISQSVPHIYISTLSFAPGNSTVPKRYMERYPHILVVGSGGQSDWPAIQNVISGHMREVTSVSFSPDGRHIVSGSRDNTIRVWDAETGEVAAGPFEGHESAVFSVAFSPDGRRVVSGSGDKTIRVWDATTGEVVAGPLVGHTDWIRSVVFSPDGGRIVSGSKDKTIRLWDGETGEAVGGLFAGHRSTVHTVAFSPDGRRIASGSRDSTIRVWDAETGEVAVGPFEGHESAVFSVAFSPDGRHIVSGSGDQSIRVWDAKTGEVIAGPFVGHADWIWSVTFSPDGRYVGSGSGDSRIRVWDIETGEVIARPFEGHIDRISSVAFSPDGRRIVSGSDDRTVRIWDIERGEIVADPLEGHESAVFSVAFSPDGRRIVSGSGDESIRVWDAKTSELVVAPLVGHASEIWSVAFSPDGRGIASGSGDSTIRVWDAETGEVVAGPFEGHIDRISSVAFSPDGRRIISGSDDRTIRIWDARTGEIVAGPLEGHESAVFSVAFSPNGRRIASGSSDSEIRIWHGRTGKKIVGPFKGHADGVWSVAFSPDGSRLASGSDDRTIRVWDARTGQMVAGPLEGHESTVFSVSFSPNGRYIVTGSDDRTIRVWNAETGEMAAGPLEGHTGRIWSVTFSPDGKRIVSGSHDRTIRVWDVERIDPFVRLSTTL